jgi:serine/threonine-protein kinase
LTVEDFASADENLLGRVIGGKFTIRECIGVGASGAVYLADQHALGRTVAIKILRQDLASDPRLVRRFHDEALAASRLNHPNTVSVIDYGQTEDGLLFLVMEYLRGLTLTEMLESPVLTDTLIADIITQILSGLEDAHDAGVVHADLKADNILIEHRRDDWYLVKVVDFGIARLIGSPDEENERTICGTPEYMAPEVIRGADPTFASDIYAVGVVLYELLTGYTPFVTDNPMEVLSRHLRETAPPPSSMIDRPIDPTLESAALKALAKSPADRFGSATEFREVISPRVQRFKASGEEVVCTECGVQSSVSFKFCPECGAARLALAKTQEIETTGLLAPARRPSEPSATKRFAHHLDTDPSAGGVFPLPMTGRDSELAALAQFLGEQGDSHMLQVVGPRGTGRSRVIREACRTLTSGIIYVTDADPSGLASPFYPVRALVAGILHLPPITDHQWLGSALEKLGLGERDLPGVGELFGLEGKLRQLDPKVRRRELLVSTSRILLAAADKQPAVLVFKNVDRYDHPSQDVLRRLAESRPGTGLRIVATNGPEFAARWPGLVARINLDPLEPAAVERIAGHLGRFEVDLDAADLESAGGLPAHIEQLTRYVLEGGDAATAPRGLADLIAARLDAMPRLATQVCQGLAIFGTEVPRAILRSTLASQLAEDRFSEAINLLDARGLVELADDQLRFRNQLTRDVIYEATPANVRRELHGAAVEVLRQHTGDPAILGHHYDLANDLEHAAPLLSAAGDISVEQLDDTGACTLYNRALGGARHLVLTDDSSEHRALFVTTSIRLADALRVGGQLGLASGLLQEADVYCSDAPALRAQLLRARAHLHSTEGGGVEAIEATREAIGFAITTGNRELLAELYLDLATMYLRTGETQNAIGELEEGTDLVTAGDGATSDDGPQVLWRLLLRLCQLYASLGARPKAIDLGYHALRHADRVQSTVGMARCQAVLAVQFERIGEHEKAEELRSDAVKKMRELGDRRGTAELLLAGARTTRTMSRINPASIHEARVLAEEVGWDEGVRRASQVDE